MTDELEIDETDLPPPTRPGWSIDQAFRFGWNFLTRDWRTLLTLILSLFVAQLPMCIAAAPFIVFVIKRPEESPPDAMITALIGSAVFAFVLQAWMALGTMRYLLARVRGTGGVWTDIFRGGPFLSFLVAAVLLYNATLLSLLALIVPGVIVFLGYSMVMLLIADRRAGGLGAFIVSWRMTRGHKMSLFAFFLITYGVYLVGYYCTLGVGLLVILPFIFTTWTWIYLRLLGEEPPDPATAR